MINFKPSQLLNQVFFFVVKPLEFNFNIHIIHVSPISEFINVKLCLNDWHLRPIAGQIMGVVIFGAVYKKFTTNHAGVTERGRYFPNSRDFKVSK